MQVDAVNNYPYMLCQEDALLAKILCYIPGLGSLIQYPIIRGLDDKISEPHVKPERKVQLLKLKSQYIEIGTWRDLMTLATSIYAVAIGIFPASGLIFTGAYYAVKLSYDVYCYFSNRSELYAAQQLIPQNVQ